MPVFVNPSVPSRADLDAWLFRAVNVDGGWLMDAVAVLLSAKVFGISFGVVLALAVAIIAQGRARGLLTAALGLAVAASDGIGSQVLRPLFDRRRPCYVLSLDSVRWLAPAADVGSLPSLHAANFFAMATVAAAADARLGAFAFLVATAVALSRVYVGVHWPSDVLAGAAWGVACGLAARALVSRAMRRRRLEAGRTSP